MESGRRWNMERRKVDAFEWLLVEKNKSVNTTPQVQRRKDTRWQCKKIKDLKI